MATTLTDYEKQRLENIKANAALLHSLDIPSSDAFVAQSPETPKVKPNTKERSKAPRKSVKTESTAPTRTSRRLREAAAMDEKSVMDEAERERIKSELEQEERAKQVEEEKARQERRKWRIADREVSAIDSKGHSEKERDDGLLGVVKSLHIESASEDLDVEEGRTAKRRKINTRTVMLSTHESNPTPSTLSSTNADLESLKEAYHGASQIAALRVTSNRIYSMCVYPDIEKELIFVGDKEGWLSIWDYKSEEEEDQWSEKAWRIKLHNSQKSISDVRVREGAYLLTGSYDCSVRQLNFETAVSQQVVDLDLGVDEDDVGERLVSSFDITPDGNDIWVSDTRGGLSHRDLRENKFSTRRWRLSNKKIGCVSLHSGGIYAVTAHFERFTRLWDLRMLTLTPPSEEPTKDIEKHIVAAYETPNCCTSAYWHPSGINKLLTTSYDDCIRLYDVNFTNNSSIKKSFVPSRSLRHDTHTGRFTTVFKARYSQLPIEKAYPHFFLGNMTRTLDIFDGEGGSVVRMKASTVPAVAVGHPCRIGRAYGGAQGGQVYVFGK